MYKYNKETMVASILITLCGTSVSAPAEDVNEETWNAHFQTTYIWQKKPSFSAVNSGVNSLKSNAEKSYSFSATAALGWRPWIGGELYFDPELVQGVPLSGLGRPSPSLKSTTALISPGTRG